MKIKLLSAILLSAILGMFGCAVNQPGKRTATYGLDGLTVTSETLETPADALVEIEKEKSVQICWKEYGKANKVILDSVKENPTMVLLLKQTESLNNAMSLLKTGKSYNPCPSSPNSIDADIAESAMYTSIYHDGIDALKFLGGIWGGVEISDNLMSALSRAGGYGPRTRIS